MAVNSTIKRTTGNTEGNNIVYVQPEIPSEDDSSTLYESYNVNANGTIVKNPSPSISVHTTNTNTVEETLYYTVTFKRDNIVGFVNDDGTLDTTTSVKTIAIKNGDTIDWTLIPKIRVKDQYATSHTLINNSWYSTTSGKTIYSPVTDNITFIPGYSKVLEEEIVTYKINCVKENYESFDVVTFKSGSVINASDLPDTVMSGYTFSGWFDVDENEKVRFPITVTRDMTLMVLFIKKDSGIYKYSSEYSELENFIKEQIVPAPEVGKLEYLEQKVEKNKEYENDTTIQDAVGIVIETKTEVETGNKYTLAPVTSEDFNYINTSYRVPEIFSLTGYTTRVGNGLEFVTKKVVENSQIPGEYYIEEYSYYLDMPGNETKNILKENKELSLSKLLKKFENFDLRFYEGFYKKRGNLVKPGVYNEKQNKIYNELLYPYVLNSTSNFLNKRLLTGTELYHKMHIFSDGLHKMIESSNSLLERNIRRASGNINIEDLSVSVKIEEFNSLNIEKLLYRGRIGESGSSILEKDRNVYQRLFNYRKYPTEYAFQKIIEKENRTNFLVDITDTNIKGDNVLSYYTDNGEVIFGNDDRAHYKYSVTIDDVSPLISNILSEYFIKGSMKDSYRDVFLKDWEDHYMNKMDLLLPRIEFPEKFPNLSTKFKYVISYKDTVSDVNYLVYEDKSIVSSDSVFANLLTRTIDNEWRVVE